MYDSAGDIISEREIQQHTTGKNRLLFCLSGGILSLGTGFFLSSMASRALEDENRDAVIYGGVAGGTLIGAFIFYHFGDQKDRQAAIGELQLQSSAKDSHEVSRSVMEREQVQSELEKLRQQQSRQNEEIKRLQKQIEEKKNK